MLRFFQEIGHIIHFADEKLKDTVIINVQWFVDAFKHIITDRKHIPFETEVCDKWMKTGRIPESAFQKIWRDSNDKSYVQHHWPTYEDCRSHLHSVKEKPFTLFVLMVNCPFLAELRKMDISKSKIDHNQKNLEGC